MKLAILPFVYFIVTLLISWCVMTFTHEIGHLLGGWASGAHLQQCSLVPWNLPFSFFQPDPHPLVTLWCGPLLGVVVPVIIAWIFRLRTFWMIAYFCLLANGTYLALAWISGDHYLDTPKLLAAGAWPVSIAMYCIITIGWGYYGFRKCCLEHFQSRQLTAKTCP